MVIQYKNTSPYFKTAQINFLIEYLDFYENRPVFADFSDELIAIDPKFHQRPDFLSNNLYGTPDLWWTFAVRNPNLIIDPIYDLVSGMEIFVPTRKRMFSNILGS